MSKRKEKMRQRKETWFNNREHVCFYTGLICSKTGLFKRSIEHLLPHPWMSCVAYSEEGKELHGINKVVSLAFVNRIVDIAPLQIKFLLKEHLSGLNLSNRTTVEIKEYLTDEMEKFFSAYAIDGYLFWNYRYGRNTERSNKLWQAYKKELLPEERRLLELKKTGNVKSFLSIDDINSLRSIISKKNTFLSSYEKYITGTHSSAGRAIDF